MKKSKKTFIALGVAICTAGACLGCFAMARGQELQGSREKSASKEQPLLAEVSVSEAVSLAETEQSTASGTESLGKENSVETVPQQTEPETAAAETSAEMAEPAETSAEFELDETAAETTAEETEPDEKKAEVPGGNREDAGDTSDEGSFNIGDFRFAQSQAGLYEKIAAAGLSEEARRANGQNYLLEDRYLPIFRLNDTEELRQFGERYDDGTGGIYYTDLKHLTESFDEADLEGKTVYAIFCTMYNGTYREDEFSVEAQLRDGVLRFNVNVRAEDGCAMVDTETAYWLLIMMDSSAASSAEAFEAVFVH